MSAAAVSAARVRRATAADLDALGRLGAALARQHAGYDARRFVLPEGSVETAFATYFAARLADGAATLLVADVGEGTADGRAVGYAFARLEPPSFVDALPASGWIHDLHVVPSARGHGAGAALLDAAVEALLDAGAPLVMLAVAPANAAAQRLFAGRGFVVTMSEMTRRADAPTGRVGDDVRPPRPGT